MPNGAAYHSWLTRNRRRLLALLDALAWASSLTVFALLLYSEVPETLTWAGLAATIAIAIGLQLTIGTILWIYERRYPIGTAHDGLSVFRAIAIVTVLLTGISLLSPWGRLLPPGVTIAAGAATLVAALGARAVWRMRHESKLRPRDARPVLVIGTTHASVGLISQLVGDPGSEFIPVGLIDDDPAKRHLRIHGVPVLGSQATLGRAVQSTGAEAILVAEASLPIDMASELTRRSEELGLELLYVRREQVSVGGGSGVNQGRTSAFESESAQAPPRDIHFTQQLERSIAPLQDAPQPESSQPRGPRPTGSASRVPRLRSLAFPLLTLPLDAGAGELARIVMFPSHTASLIVAAGLLALWMAGAYRERLALSVLDYVPTLAAGLGFGLVSTLIAVAALGRADGTDVRSIALLFALWLPLLLVGRGIAYSLLRALRTRFVLNHNTVVVGASDRSVLLTRTLLESPKFGLRPIGILSTTTPEGEQELPVPLLGPPQDLSYLFDRPGVRHVIIDSTSASPGEVVHAAQECDRRNIEVFVIPRVSELLGGLAVEQLAAIPLFRLPRRPFRTVQWRVKRGLDFALSALAVVLLSPVMLIAGLLVSHETGGGWLFRQRRVGLDGRTFDVLKFQTMVPSTSQESDTNWNIAQDDRIGPVGRFLRKTSIDELPQLFNVLRGDMSLVGPRPERPHFVEVFQHQYPRYMARHRVPCGVTGFAQVEGLRGDTSIRERVAFDNLYVEQWSLWLDVKILLRTIPAVLSGSGS